jgi:endo-1,3(4)-beta-glucanase
MPTGFRAYGHTLVSIVTGPATQGLTVLLNLAGEMSNATYADDWKSVIALAYSNYDPQAAAKTSAALASWGTGNTYSNQIYFLATRPNLSGAAICTADTQNPQGTFYLQLGATGNYITSSASRVELHADSSNSSTAVAYQLSFAPNGGTIRAVNTNQYVTADITGALPIAAARASADAWEVFVIRPKVGGSGTYTLLAASNKKYVVVDSSGALVNSAATEGAGSGFRLISAGNTVQSQGTLPASGTLRHDATGRYIGINTPLTDPWLHTVNGAGTPWNFVTLTVQDGQQIYGIQEVDNTLYVTSDDAGNDQLRAFREVAMAWEYFLFEPVGGCKWNLRMTVNGKLVGVRADGSLYADQSTQSAATVFSVVGAGCPA